MLNGNDCYRVVINDRLLFFFLSNDAVFPRVNRKYSVIEYSSIDSINIVLSKKKKKKTMCVIRTTRK